MDQNTVNAPVVEPQAFQTQQSVLPNPSAPAQPQIVVQQPVNVPHQEYFTAEDIAKARREEKEKLYDDLKKQREQIKVLQEQISQWEAERRAREEAEAEEARRKAEEEMSVRDLLRQREQEWEHRFSQLQAEREAERAALEKEREFARLQSHIQRRAREEVDAGRIAPELVDLITGNTVDEVETSIQLLQQKTEQILQSVAAQTSAAQPPIRGVSPAGYAASGPMDNYTATKMYTPEELRSMSMEDYAKLRPQLFGNNAQPGQGQGLFG